MDKPTEVSMTTAALAMAACDLLVIERAKFRALIQLLAGKQLVSPAELSESLYTIAPPSQESLPADWNKLYDSLVSQMAIRLQQLKAHPTSPE
jgi:hypothetical protein